MADRRYTKTHEWIAVEGKTATVGITDFAQSELGDIVYVDLPSPGRVLHEGETMGSVESVKTVSDMYAPLAGTVSEVNEALGSQTEQVNADPYGKGWMLKIRVNDPSEAATLLEPAAYQQLEH